MAGRSPSPVASETGYDITQSLFPHDESSESDDGGADHQHPERKARMEVEEEQMPDLAADSGSDDAEFIAGAQAASNRKASNAKGRTVKKGGGFQAMGLNAYLLKAITRKGFSVPTPIQRKTIPLVLDGRDVVGMARTGSGKTAAFVIPMVEKLKAHSARIGSRAVIFSPSRELALQTLKVVKELGRGTDLKCVLLVGGDSLEEQFALMAGNPDIVIATPGRFLHLQVEMKLDLSSVRYVVFDEADRLFEMGFAAQLSEILHALPPSRQTLLFSATLPKSLVEFARAGLQEPTLVRLDADSKVSPDLQSAFFTLKSADKEGALLHILNDIIQMPTGETEASKQRAEASSKPGTESKKRKRGEADGTTAKESPTEHSTIIFTATKHHVEYIATFLRLVGFAVSYAYGSLDQTARKIQVQDFRTGMTNILVVTDVAARGIDIPVLANVINYDFPPQPKVFVHRVGRTARAGQTGWSYSLVRESDAPYLLDLQLFLGRTLVLGHKESQRVNFAEDVAVGSFTREGLERNCESAAKRLAEGDDLRVLQSVAAKGEKLYQRTRNAASIQSARRAKEMLSAGNWMALHSMFSDETNSAELEREKMLARVSGFRPPESVFEFGKKGSQSETAEIMKKRRKIIAAQKAKTDTLKIPDDEQESLQPPANRPEVASSSSTLREDTPSSSASELEVQISDTTEPNHQTPTFQDPSHFMSYTPTTLNAYEERAYGVHSGSTSHKSNGDFLQAAASQTLNLTADDGKSFAEPSRARGLRWDKKSKRYVARANDEDGSRGKGAGKLVVGEGGTKIAASFRSGRFDDWKRKNRVSKLPRVGDVEKNEFSFLARGYGGPSAEKKWKHQSTTAPREADKYRDDYYKKKKMVEKAKEGKVGRFSEKGKKGEVRNQEGVRKVRREEERKKAKNARGGFRGGRGGSRGRGRGRA